jgi:hypothetical protein
MDLFRSAVVRLEKCNEHNTNYQWLICVIIRNFLFTLLKQNLPSN